MYLVTRHKFLLIILILINLTLLFSEIQQSNVTATFGGSARITGNSYSGQITVGRPFMGSISTEDGNLSGDIGAWSFYKMLPSTPKVEASDGEYVGKIKVEWTQDILDPPGTEDTKVYKENIANPLWVGSSQKYFFDEYDISPGEYYNYSVVLSNSYGESNVASDIGFVNPNGIITGRIHTPNNNGVKDVLVLLEPSLGYCLDITEDELLVVNDSITALNQDFTFEAWLKSTDSNFDIFSKGNNKLRVDSDNKICFTVNNTPIFIQGSMTNVNNGVWHHIAFIVSATSTKLYIDGVETDSIASLSQFDDLASYIEFGKDFTGSIDDIRFWSTARDSVQIYTNMNRVLPSDVDNLVGYWPLNEGMGSFGYDGTNNNNKMYIESDDRWLVENENVKLAGLTDTLGYYNVNQVPFEATGTTYSISPQKHLHTFEPEMRLITLSSSNISCDGVDFVDNSLVSVSGQIKYSNSNIKIPNARIWVNGDSTTVLTDSEGMYVIDLEPGGDYQITSTYRNHDIAKTWNFTNLTTPKSGIDFWDSSTKELHIAVKGGRNNDFNIGNFEIECISVNDDYGIKIASDGSVSSDLDNSPTNVLLIEIDNNWADGNIVIQNAPPIEYNVKVTSGGDNIPLSLKHEFAVQNPFDIQNVSLIDSVGYCNFNWRSPLYIEYDWSNSGADSLYYLSGYPESKFRVLTAFVSYDVDITIYEDYELDGVYQEARDQSISGIIDLVVSDGSVLADDLEFNDGVSNIEFYPRQCYLGGIEGRQYQLQIYASAVNDVGKYAECSDWIFIEGERMRETQYVTTSPVLPICILHDPPGDNSYSYMAADSTASKITQISFSHEENDYDQWWASLGPQVTTSLGLGAEVELELDVIVDGVRLDGETTVREGEKALLQEFTVRETISTSSSDSPIGPDADVFLGYSQYFTYGLTDVISFDADSLKADLSNNVKFIPDEIGNTYLYTRAHIENTLIPNLESALEAADGNNSSEAIITELTDAIENWKNIQKMFESSSNSIGEDFLWANEFDEIEDIAFSSGLTYENSITLSQDSTYSFDSTIFLSRDESLELGLTIDDVGGSYLFGHDIVWSQVSESDFANWQAPSNPEEWDDAGIHTETTYGYVLSDDDASGTVSSSSDNFLVKVYQDPFTSAPSFETLGGQSMSPWERKTAPREGVNMTISNGGIANNVDADMPAVFIATLTNTSQTEEEQIYKFEVVHGTNNTGAVVRVNGIPLEGTMDIQVPGSLDNNSVQTVITIDKGPISNNYNIDGLKLRFYAENDLFNSYYTWDENQSIWAEDNSHSFWVEREINIEWKPPYSKVSIQSPQEGWLVNNENADTLWVTLNDYDINVDKFKELQLQYNTVDGDMELWMPAFTIPHSNLIGNNIYSIESPWEIPSGLADGEYLIRAVAVDSLNNRYYSQHLTGIIDRNAPQIMGQPHPLDGILGMDDEIAVYFDEVISQEDLSNYVVMFNTRTEEAVDVEALAFENKLVLTPIIANKHIENEELCINISKIYDNNGNYRENPLGPIDWEFYVDRNPVEWDIGRIEVIMEIGQPLTVSANLSNIGGRNRNWIISDYADSLYYSELVPHSPDLFNVSPLSGDLLAQDYQQVDFEIDNQLGFGVHCDTIFAHSALGNEALVIKVSVVSNPPEWTETVNNNYQYAKTITGILDIEGAPSTDVNDIVGAFIENDEGVMECCGVATVSANPVLDDDYIVYLTIYNNFIENQPIEFRVWDSSENKQYYGFTNQFYFNSNIMEGTPFNPVSLTTTDNLLQEVSVNNGWSWVSLNLETSDMSVESVLSSLNPQTGDLIQQQNGFYSQYNQDFDSWGGALNNLTTESMYKVKLSSPGIIEHIGVLEEPSDVSISMNEGWNWISYIPHVSMSVNEAFSGFNNISNEDIILSQQGYAVYSSRHNEWFGSLVFMNPNNGYMYKANNSGTLNYPEYDAGLRHDSHESIAKPYRSRTSPEWNVDYTQYQYSAITTAKVYFNDEEYNSTDVIVGAFVDGECRGVTSPISAWDDEYCFLSSYSNTFGEEVTFQVYLQETDQVYTSTSAYWFSDGLILGSPSEPFAINIYGDEIGSLAVPTNISLEVNGDITVISWDHVPDAISYKIYASDNPNSNFNDVTSRGSFIIESRSALNNKLSDDHNDTRSAKVVWEIDDIEEYLFFYVVASTDENYPPTRIHRVISSINEVKR